MNRLTNNLAVSISLLYAVSGALWIAFSDWVLPSFLQSNLQLAQWQTVSGWLWIAASTLLIYLLLRAAQAAQNAKLHALEASARYRLLVDGVPNYAIIMVDPDGVVLTWNPGAEAINGYSAGEAIGQHISLLYPYGADNKAYIHQQLDAARRAGKLEEEGWRVPKNGQLYWVNTTITPLYEPDGTLVGYARISRDQTDKQLAGVQIRRLNRSYSVLSSVNKAITRLRQPLELFEEACTIAVEKGGFRMAWIGLLDEQTRTVHPVAHAGAVDGYLDSLHIVLDDSPYGRGPTATALLAGQHIVIDDIAEDPRMAAWRERALDMGYRSSAAFPLLVNGEIRGVLNLYAPEAHFFDDAVIHLMDEMASDIAFALEYSRQEQRRKQAEADREQLFVQVHAQAEQMAQIMRSVPEGVVLLDAGACVVLANPQAVPLLDTLAGVQVGGTLAELGGQPFGSLLPAQAGPQWHRLQAAGRTFEIVVRPLEGESIPGGWVMVIRDVTEDVMVQAQLQRQERLAAVGQLAAGIAHDFNNIMSVIVMYAQVTMLSPGLTDQQRERLAVIDQQAMRASQMIRQILDFSRRSILDRQQLDLVPLVKEQVKLLERTLQENIEIELVHPPEPCFIKADPIRLQQVLMNLAVNARDAMPDGGRLCLEIAHIQPGSSEQGLPPGMAPGAWVRLKVADTGTGIAPAVLEHMFEPFYTTKDPGKGTGLGLAQVHGIVGQHEGHITVESKLGVGTTFTIYLPALAVITPGSLAAFAPADLPRGRGQKILVVEDNAPLRATLVELLCTWGYTVAEANHGQEALAYLASPEASVDLILSDVVMPHMGGIGLFNAIQRQGLAIPMLLISGNQAGDTLDSLCERGLRGILAKPPSTEQLANAIARALGRG